MKTTTHPLQDTLKNVKSSAKIKSIKVLLVGNNPLELGQCCRSLINYRTKKFNIETAFSAEECFRKVLKFKPAIIILDDSVGFMNMIEITEKLNKDTRFTTIPVIVIKNSNYHHATLNEGVDEFIMLDRVLGGELPHLVLETIFNKRIKVRDSKALGAASSFEKKLSKLLWSFFSSNKISAD